MKHDEKASKTLRTKYGMGDHTLALINTASMDKETWLAVRGSLDEGAPCTLGGSEISSVVGLNPWKSTLALWKEKTENVAPEFDPETLERFQFGHIMEEVASEVYKQRHPDHEVVRCNYLLGMAGYPGYRANLDRLVKIDGKWGVMEIKNISEYNTKSVRGEDGEFTIPDYYRAQIQWYMTITGLEFAEFVAVLGGNRLRSVRMDFDDTLSMQLGDAAAVFMDHVRTRKPPKDYSPESLDDWKTMVKAGKESMDAESNPTIHRLITTFRGLNDTVKEQQARIDQIKAEILHRMGDKYSVVTLGGKKAVNVISVKGANRFDRKSFALEYPELDARFSNIGDPTQQVRFT